MCGIKGRMLETFVDSFCCLIFNVHSLMPIWCNVNTTDLEVYRVKFMNINAIILLILGTSICLNMHSFGNKSK